jgi:hypothetical protein
MMPYTQADLDAAVASVRSLNAALGDGVRQVTLPGGQVTIYQTTESLKAARDDALGLVTAIRAALDAATAGTTPRRQPIAYLMHLGRE